MDEVDEAPEDAMLLLRYFERVLAEKGDEQSKHGAHLCREWARLASHGAAQHDIDAFVARLATEPNPGTGWVDLGLRFRYWARERGLRA